MEIIKRDGTKVEFDSSKIENAIKKAGESLVKPELSPEEIHTIALSIEAHARGAGHILSVEEIQDLVETSLIMQKAAETAKRYIRYRFEHNQWRNSHKKLMEAIGEIVNVDARKSDQKRENANINGNSAMGAMLQIGTTTSKEYNMRYLLNPEHAKAFKEGYIHIHDFDFYALTTTCTQIDILKLFHGGFSTGHGFLREPQSISSYGALAAIGTQSNQNDQHGGQSYPNFDYGMAEGIAKTFRKQYQKNMEIVIKSLSDILSHYDKVIENHVESVISDAKDKFGEDPKLVNSDGYDAYIEKRIREDYGTAYAKAAVMYIRELTTKATDRETYQAMESFVHNLNTMHSRAGAQVPFSSINYGTDTSPEGRMAIKNILLALDAGLGHGETCIFPIHIFKVKEGVNFNPGDPNYDLFKLSCKVTAKRLFPNFTFLDSPFNLQYYKPGHPETEVATMGCRTRVIGNVYDPSREVSYSRGNLSFTSINLPRLALESKSEEEFYQKLDHMLELCAQQLLDRFEIQASKHVYNYPFLMGQGVWIDSDKLGPEDTVREVLKHGTLSIGFIGLAETLTALYGHHHGESDEMQAKGLEIIGHMRDFCDKKSQEMKMNFTLLATPAESLSGRFTRIDKEKFGEIPGVTDRDYYTNSFHIPVWYPITAYRKIQLEAPYHALCNAGHISYVELDGDTAKNVEAVETIVRWMHDCKIGYGSINHPVDRDPVCGYVGVIGDVCPRCGRHDGEEISPEKVAELRKRFPEVQKFLGIQ